MMDRRTLLTGLSVTGAMLGAGLPALAKAGSKGVIEVDFDGARIRVRGAVDALALRTIVEALAQR